MRKVIGVLTVVVLLEICSVIAQNRTIDSDEQARSDNSSSSGKGRSMSDRESKRERGTRKNKHNGYTKSRKYFQDHCRDKHHTIREPHDLKKYKSELDCIFRRAYTPPIVPEGPLHGTVISVMKTDWFNQFIGFLWNGKIILKTSCNGKPSYIGWNNLGSSPSFPFMGRIGPLDETLEHGEHEDDHDSLVLDYTKDFSKVCPEFKDIAKSRTNMHNMFQLNQIVMVLRIVGKKRDGSAIYLGKTYFKDGPHGDKKVRNIAYFAGTNFDPNINPPRSFERDSKEDGSGSSENSRRDGGNNGGIPNVPNVPSIPGIPGTN